MKLPEERIARLEELAVLQAARIEALEAALKEQAALTEIALKMAGL